MKLNPPNHLVHSHAFGQDKRQAGESRTQIVIAITLFMMAIEVAAGIYFGSMALLADGLHMASHSAALAITAFAYAYARKHANNPKFSFGTGKVNALGGFTGALLLAGFSFFMAWESVDRLINPTEIAFNWAIAVAVIGLVVNGASMLVLGHHGHDHHHHGHDHDHAHEHHHHEHHEHGHHHHEHHEHEDSHHQDHNLRSAYLHVMADALTSITAIFALLAAKFFGLLWMDPVMGIVGAALVANWSIGLIRSTSQTLLDCQIPEAGLAQLKSAIESDGSTQVTDLHVWSIGPGIQNASITIVSPSPLTVQDYKERIPDSLGIVHSTVEIHQSP